MDPGMMLGAARSVDGRVVHEQGSLQWQASTALMPHSCNAYRQQQPVNSTPRKAGARSSTLAGACSRYDADNRAPCSICSSSASTYCTVSSFVTFLRTDIKASTYAGPDCHSGRTYNQSTHCSQRQTTQWGITCHP